MAPASRPNRVQQVRPEHDSSSDTAPLQEPDSPESILLYTHPQSMQVHLLECLKDGTVCAMTASRITASMRMMDAELYQFSATSCTLDAARSFPSLGHSVRVVERRTLGPILQMMRHRRAGRNIGSPCFLRSSLGWQSNASVCWKGLQYTADSISSVVLDGKFVGQH